MVNANKSRTRERKTTVSTFIVEKQVILCRKPAVNARFIDLSYVSQPAEVVMV